MLLGLEKFCNDSKLNVNVKKTKCIIFNKTGRIIHRISHYKGILLENVRSYKYLGFIVTPSGSITRGLEDLRDRALKALMKIRHGMGKLFNKSIRGTINIFDYTVKPILLYASDFWGCHKLPVNNPIDRLLNSSCRHILGVQKNTTTMGVLLEVGKVPLSLSAVKATVKNWEMLTVGKGTPLILLSYENAMEETFKWIQNIKNCLQCNGMMASFIYPDKNVHKKLSQKDLVTSSIKELLKLSHQKKAK